MSHFLSLFNAFAASWADALVRACWQGGLGIALVWLLCRLWPGLPPAPRCWFWRLVYAKLLLGLLWLPPLALPLLPHPSARIAALPEASPPARLADAPLPAAAGPVFLLAPPPSPSAAPSILPQPRLPTVQTWLLAAWLLGVLVGLGRLCAAWRRARRLYDISTPLADEALRADAADLCRRLDLRRVPPLRVADGLASPLLLGLTRPAVLMPAFVLSESPHADLRLILAHELAHLARRDLLWNILPLTAQRLFFFHPLVWLAGHEWRLAQEIACDSQAVAMTGTSPSVYGRMLLGIATRRASAASLFPTLAVAAPRHTLRRRLFAMQHLGTASRPRLFFAAALTLALAVVGLLPWRVVAQSGPSPSTPAVASQSEATREKNIQKERASMDSQNAQLDAQIAEMQKRLSPAQLKEVQPEIASVNAMYAKQQQRVQLLEQDRAEYATAHPNRLSDEQVAFIRHFNWFRWKPTRIRANIRREQITKRKLQAKLASERDAHSRQDDEQQIEAIDQRRRQGENQIRDWQPIIDGDRAQIALLPVDQSDRVAKLDSYDLDITVNKLDALIEKQVWVSSLRRRLNDKLSTQHHNRRAEPKGANVPPHTPIPFPTALATNAPPLWHVAQLVREGTEAAQPSGPANTPAKISPVMAEALDKEIAHRETYLRTQEQQRAAYLAAHPGSLSDAQKADLDQLQYLTTQCNAITSGIAWGEVVKSKLRAHLAQAHDARSRQGFQAQIAAIDAARRNGETHLPALETQIAHQKEVVAPIPQDQRLATVKKGQFNTSVTVEGTVIAFLKARRAGEAWAQASITSAEFNPSGLQGQRLNNMRRFEQEAQRDKYIAEHYVWQLATFKELRLIAPLQAEWFRRMQRSNAPHAS